MSVLLSPIVQFRGADREYWWLSVFIAKAENQPPAVNAAIPCATRLLAAVPSSRPKAYLFRSDFRVARTAGSFQAEVDGQQIEVSVPGPNEMPRCAYVSCNGFSDPKLVKGLKDKNNRWKHLLAQHELGPYQLLLMGGDQIYSDSMWQDIPELKRWAEDSWEKRKRAQWTVPLKESVERFFANLYLERWKQPELAKAFSSIPSVMMWDDHDIMDGWGSYPEEQHNCPVYQGIFSIAKRYFRLFQLQLADDEQHPLAIPGQAAFNLGCRNLGGGMALLTLDLRSERQPQCMSAGGHYQPEQIMSAGSANAVYDWLSTHGNAKHLLVMSSVPVCYLDLAYLEKLLASLPGQQELEDDLRDHWRSPAHQGERKRFLQRLLSHAEEKQTRVTLLSGDVHVGGLCVLESNRSMKDGNAAVINQLISSGVVHPPAPGIVLYVLEQIADREERVDRGIVSQMQPIAPKGSYLIARRNWLAIEPDDQGRLWANWHLEDERVPITKVIHPVS